MRSDIQAAASGGVTSATLATSARPATSERARAWVSADTSALKYAETCTSCCQPPTMARTLTTTRANMPRRTKAAAMTPVATAKR